MELYMAVRPCVFISRHVDRGCLANHERLASVSRILQPHITETLTQWLFSTEQEDDYTSEDDLMIDTLINCIYQLQGNPHLVFIDDLVPVTGSGETAAAALLELKNHANDVSEHPPSPSDLR